MKITCTQDWQEVERDLRSQIKMIRYNPDLIKMKKNIEIMITELSRQEVEARRTKNPRYLLPQLDKINTAIHNLEKWILMLQLSQ
jgi:hypothetical protein